MVDSFVKGNKKYYTQILLQQCKCETKKTKTENLIKDDLEASSSDNETDSETESDLTINLTMKNLLKFKTAF